MISNKKMLIKSLIISDPTKIYFGSKDNWSNKNRPKFIYCFRMPGIVYTAL